MRRQILGCCIATASILLRQLVSATMAIFCCDGYFLPQLAFCCDKCFLRPFFLLRQIFSAATGVFCDNASQRTAKLRIYRKKQTTSVLFFVFSLCNAFAKHVGTFSKNVGVFPKNDGLFPKNDGLFSKNVGDFSRSVREKISRARGFSRQNATRKSNLKKSKIQKSKKPQFLYKKESQFLFCSLQVALFLGGLVFLEILGFLVQLRQPSNV